MLRGLAGIYMLLILLGAPLAVGLPSGWPPPVAWLALQAGLSLLFVSVGVVLALRWLNPPTSAFMLRARTALRREGSAAHVEFCWVDEACLPLDLLLAAIVSEDTYFAFHEGFDWDSLRAAYVQNRAGAPMRGGSTISQQVAKNLFLWPEQSYLRKAIEAYFTLLIETAWSKRRILEVYLNLAQFGPRTFGAGAAARRFFGKPARELTAREAALLVAVLPNPLVYRVDRPTHPLRYRQLMILAGMRKLGGAYLACLGARPARQV